MHHLAVSDVHRHMVDASAASIENQIARLHLADADLRAAVRLGSGGMRKGNAVVAVHRQSEAGAVRALGQAGAAPYVAVPHILLGELTDINADVCNAFSIKRLCDGKSRVQLVRHLYILRSHIAFLAVDIVPAVLFIGVCTFTLSCAGVKIGAVFGDRFKSKAEIAGGIILVLIGLKILLEHLGVISF